MNLIHKARVTLINMGKMLPFFVCAIVFISYAETLFSAITSDYIVWGGAVIPNKRLTWLIGAYFEYDYGTLLILLIISIAIETCYWNKLSIIYLWVQLYEKDYFLNIEISVNAIYIVASINMIVCCFIVYKGICAYFKH